MNQINILVADDDKDIIEVLTRLLEQEGYHIYQASNGIEALEILQKQEIQLVLLDVMMPQMNGLLELDRSSKQMKINGTVCNLTATEYKIMELLMENAGRVFSAEQIYQSVWNEDAYSIENTVMIHIRRIREKIEINPKKQIYLKVVWGIGYKIEKC